MASEHQSLCSVHYTPDSLRELEDKLQRVDDEIEVQYGFPRGGGLMTAESAEEMVSNLISDEVTTFYITANSASGSLILSGDGTGKDAEHRLIVDGDEPWRDAMIRGVKQITKSNETSRVRSFLHSKYIGYIQSVLIGGLIFWNIRYFWPVLGIPYYVEMPISVAILSLLGIVTIFGLEILDRLYPYVAIRRDSGPSRLYRVLAHLAMIGSIAGLLMLVYTFGGRMIDALQM